MTLLIFGFDWDSPMPFNPSPSVTWLPPHKVLSASRPLILIPKLLVLLKTAAMIGKTSFLMVEKSRDDNMTGSVPRAASTTEWVGDSNER